MAALIVYDDVAKDAELEAGQLFEGKKFWVMQRVPQRVALLELIKANGGQIVLLEKQADYLIADHFRPKICPPGSISYEFVHKSIAEAEMLDPYDFEAGPRTDMARDVGSLTRPPKGLRAAYTPEEDRILYKWVNDAKASGIAVSGNELYKQLEQKYPRHTWQSWRDRYLKQLQNRPPSAFNIPDNAPPSPPSDQSSRVADPAPVVERVRLVKNKDKARGITREQRATSEEQVAREEEYTVDQLAATFTTDDWEELYAFVEEIESTLENKEGYLGAWAGWAERKDNQTASQWRQYFEKVVRPQWRQDPVSKRERIRKKVEEKHKDDSSSPVKSQSWSQAQEQEQAIGASLTAPAKPLKRGVSNILPSDTRLESSSTAQHETPQYIRDGYESVLKRIRGEGVDDIAESEIQARPNKRRKSVSGSPTLVAQADVVGTQDQPLETPSAVSSQASAEQQSPEEIPVSQNQEQAARVDDEDTDLDNTIESDDDFTHIAPLPRPPTIPDDESDDLPSNTPTPRANKTAAFDTQAIMSSPSQPPLNIPKLPRPPLDSSPPHHSESEASTTQSLEEFSRILKEHDVDDATQTQPHFTRLPHLTSPTPSATSDISSAGSGDPDEPLAAEEMEDFFEEQHAEGFNDEFITKALKRTRFRPGLAVAVLDAWKEGNPLPNVRGVWSLEDDEMVVSGDGAALAALERKHSLDGWGGITERVNWLRAWERR